MVFKVYAFLVKPHKTVFNGTTVKTEVQMSLELVV